MSDFAVRATPIILLAGGKSTRMGRDKTQLEYEGETLLKRAFRRFSEHFAHVYVSVASPQTQLAGIPPECLLTDVLPNLGPMSGLHAALSRFDAAFLVAVDMPLAEPQLAARIINAAAAPQSPAEAYSAVHGGAYAPFVVAATTDGKAEPTFSFYSRAVLTELNAAIERGDYSINRLLKQVPTRYLEVPRDTLLNVNYPQDYEKLLAKSDKNV